MSAKQNAPVIIKRKKVVGGDGHHGGAWKVAYADFVTAMMAFFMLMWLLNATTEKQRKGIADYFNPTIPVNRISGGGEGSFGGTNIFSENTLARDGTGASARHPTEQHQARGSTGNEDLPQQGDSGEAQDAALEKLDDVLSGRSGESLVSEQALRHIVTRVTDEGLIVELFDLPDQPLFLPDGDEAAPVLAELTAMIAEVFGLVGNDVAVAGFVAARPVVLAENPIWDQSTNRADRVRSMLEGGGVESARMDRVTGYADRRPSVRNPMAPRNNRIEITLLRDQP